MKKKRDEYEGAAKSGIFAERPMLKKFLSFFKLENITPSVLKELSDDFFHLSEELYDHPKHALDIDNLQYKTDKDRESLYLFQFIYDEKIRNYFIKKVSDWLAETKKQPANISKMSNQTREEFLELIEPFINNLKILFLFFYDDFTPLYFLSKMQVILNKNYQTESTTLVKDRFLLILDGLDIYDFLANECDDEAMEKVTKYLKKRLAEKTVNEDFRPAVEDFLEMAANEEYKEQSNQLTRC